MFYGVGCCVDQRPCGPSERRHKKTGILQNVNIRKISWTEHATKRRNAGNDWRKRVLIHTLRKRNRKWIAARNGYLIINERKKQEEDQDHLMTGGYGILNRLCRTFKPA